MLRNSPFYAGFAVDDVARAKEFYGQTLGVDVVDLGTGLLSLRATKPGPKQAWFKVPAGNILSVIED